MRIARVADRNGAVFLARVDGQEVQPILGRLAGAGRDPLREALERGLDVGGAPLIEDAMALADCRLLAPVVAPQKVLAIGLNYADHARETGGEPPRSPVVFAKMPSSIVGPDEPISYSEEESTQVDYEAELAVVIGRRARRIPVEEALSFVFGYTACNDVSARDAQFADGQWVRGKSFDTFCPLGPWIVTADEVADVQDLSVVCRVNGAVMQDGTTQEMLFGVAELVSRLSRVMTLEPGDVIATGTPAGVGFARTPPVFLLDGDLVEVEIEGIGVLHNAVVVERGDVPGASRARPGRGYGSG